MQFSLTTLSDLLSEFQKYLIGKTPKATYYALGLLIAVLGALIGYIIGWETIVGAWNRLDIFFQIVLTITAGLIFFLLAYVLGSLQGAVERWFQGDWPYWLARMTRQLSRHRTIWQERDQAFQEMMTLYSQIRTTLNEVTQWALIQPPSSSIVQTKQQLPRYHIITDQDIEITTVDTLPYGAIQSVADAIGKLVQHPLDKGIILTSADLIYIPDELRDLRLLSITVETGQVPQGLVAGDIVTIYIPPNDHHPADHLKAALAVDVQPMWQERTHETKIDLIHLTLALAMDDIDKYMTFIGKNKPHIILHPAQPAPTVPATNANSQNIVSQQPSLQSPSSSDITQIPDKIEALRDSYEQGKQWLTGLRSGSLEQFTLQAGLKQVNELLDLLISLLDSSTQNGEQLLKWSREVNDYRNKWIELLQTAFKEIEYRVDQNQKFFYLHYPATIEIVAPTTIGNIFRSVDSYCDTLYGLDTALVLSRLQIVIGQDTRDQLTTAHDHLSLLEWLYCTSITIGIAGTVISFLTHHYFLACLFWLLVLPIPSITLYPAIIMAALDYAAALRLAFDRERGKVITMTGFPLPSSINQDQEKALWKQIQQWWVYGTPPGEYTLNMGETSNEKNT